MNTNLILLIILIILTVCELILFLTKEIRYNNCKKHQKSNKDTESSRVLDFSNKVDIENNYNDQNAPIFDINKFIHICITQGIQSHESGQGCASEDYICSIIKDHRQLVLTYLDAIYTIYNRLADELQKIVGIYDIKMSILVSIMHLDFGDDKVTSKDTAAIHIASLALEDKDLEIIQDYGIQCFENWGGLFGVEYLKRMNPLAPYLKEYRDGVVTELINQYTTKSRRTKCKDRIFFGPTPTSFTPKSYAEELNSCKKFFKKQKRDKNQ
jgi:hypothetical protein